jgi:hypothetical protein
MRGFSPAHGAGKIRRDPRGNIPAFLKRIRYSPIRGDNKEFFGSVYGHMEGGEIPRGLAGILARVLTMKKIPASEEAGYSKDLSQGVKF